MLPTVWLILRPSPLRQRCHVHASRRTTGPAPWMNTVAHAAPCATSTTNAVADATGASSCPKNKSPSIIYAKNHLIPKDNRARSGTLNRAPAPCHVAAHIRRSAVIWPSSFTMNPSTSTIADTASSGRAMPNRQELAGRPRMTTSGRGAAELPTAEGWHTVLATATAQDRGIGFHKIRAIHIGADRFAGCHLDYIPTGRYIQNQSPMNDRHTI